MDDLAPTVRALQEEADATRQRRLLVLHGEAGTTRRAARETLETLEATDRDLERSVVLGPDRIVDLPVEAVPPDRSGELLGRTFDAVVHDAHAALDPDTIGRAVGTVAGGGLYVLLCPPLDAWPGRRDAFDERLAVPPHGVEAVAGRFRSRLVASIRRRPGIAVVDVDAGTVERSGLTGAVGPPADPDVSAPERPRFPDETFARCRTPDQARVVDALQDVDRPDAALVVEADRGRGKSSAAGLAAGALAAEGRTVAVTGPGFAGAREVLARAEELLQSLDLLEAVDGSGRTLRTPDGAVRYVPPDVVPEAVRDGARLVVVDEAAALPVHRLTDLLEGDAGTAFVTTVHGYEGAGRGFSVRFRDRLEASDRDVRRLTMTTPIRHAPDDPLEAWSFDALLLDAEPAPAPTVEDATPAATTYRALDRDALVEDEATLREAFGLLVVAHYRTRPSDLARLLDAPNVRVRALTAGGHVAAVALVAREGGLDVDRRRAVYEGERVPGSLIPDVLTSQLRDPDGAVPVGWRVVRIATHPAVRSRGMGSKLLDGIRDEADADWVGTAYGATPRLLRFWSANGYATVHLATSRNPTSGEHGVLMLDPLTEAGRDLHDRTTRWFLDRIPSVLADALSDLDPDVVRNALAAADGPVDLDLSDRAWRLLAASAYGPGIYDVAPAPFRRLALKHLVERDVDLDADAERLLVAKVLQARPWDAVVEDLGRVSKRTAMRALGDAVAPLVDRYGGDAAKREADRYR